MNYNNLLEAVQSAAGLRLRLRLQPLYGQGEIIFPCTVSGGKYQSSKRRIPGHEESVPCTLIDSVQSQANRMEDALLGDIHDGKLKLPHLVTNFTNVEGLLKPVGEITDLEAPHRVFDAIFRDSVDANGTHFPLTDQGKAAIQANASDASAIFAISPVSLLFGSWDSTGISGGLGEKYTRCVVSELVAINSEEQDRRAGTRIDPLNIAKGIEPVEILKSSKDRMWHELAKNRKMKRPSEINHSSVPWGDKGDVHAGITCDYIQQSTTISFSALRLLGFPTGDKEKSAAAHAVLAAIALHACALNVERGWHLRSRCDLECEAGQDIQWELIGKEAQAVTLRADETRELLNDAIKAAKTIGLPWNDGPIELTPSIALQKLVVKSQEAHREDSSED